MEENILTCLENFDVLWRRVSPGAFPAPAVPAPPPEPSVTLDGLWQSSAGLVRSYRWLAGCFQGEGRSLLQQHARESDRQARRLKAECFLRRGECPRPAAPVSDQGGKLTRLRRLYLQEKSLAAALERAAQAENDPAFSACLSAFSEASAQRAEENRQLLLRCF